MKRTLILLLLILGGCTASRQTEGTIQPPELVKLAPLPPFSGGGPRQSFRLDFMLHVMATGDVEDARLTRSSGDKAWDSLALQSVRQWRFTAGRYEGQPTDLWVRQEVTVYLHDPSRLQLAELVVKSQMEADSLYGLLIAGASFDVLAKEHSIAQTRDRGGALGTVDINLYPSHVRDALDDLKEGDVTRPLKVGDTFVIFKRLRPNASPVP